jgi:saccharopine dehydrogenase-like NADP-dependent oxidoreductase
LADREVEVGGVKVNAREFTFALLEPLWFQAEGSEEFTVMRIEVEGGGPPDAAAPRRIVWDLLDRSDRERGETSMARTTGFPAAICARRILDGSIKLEPGVHPPEDLGRDDAVVAYLLADLEARGVVFQRAAPNDA